MSGSRRGIIRGGGRNEPHRTLSVPEQRFLLLQHGATVRLQEHQLSVTFGETGEPTTSKVPISIARRGTEVKIINSARGSAINSPDPVLLKLVVLARAAQQAQLGGCEEPLVAHFSKAHLQQLLRISWLAPDILCAICEGRQAPTLTGHRLLRATNIPLPWVEQRKLFGFA